MFSGKWTVKELSEALKVEYPTAMALVKLMVATGNGKEVGKRAASGPKGKGKPSVIYELNHTFTMTLPNAPVSVVVTAVVPEVPKVDAEIPDELPVAA